MTNKQHASNLLCGIPRNDHCLIFLEYMIEKPATAMLTRDKIVIKLAGREAVSQFTKALGQNISLFANGNFNCYANSKRKRRNSYNGDESDEGQDHKCKPA
jgi:hypothetical protein